MSNKNQALLIVVLLGTFAYTTSSLSQKQATHGTSVHAVQPRTTGSRSAIQVVFVFSPYDCINCGYAFRSISAFIAENYPSVVRRAVLRDANARESKRFYRRTKMDIPIVLVTARELGALDTVMGTFFFIRKGKEIVQVIRYGTPDADTNRVSLFLNSLLLAGGDLKRLYSQPYTLPDSLTDFVISSFDYERGAGLSLLMDRRERILLLHDVRSNTYSRQNIDWSQIHERFGIPVPEMPEFRDHYSLSSARWIAPDRYFVIGSIPNLVMKDTATDILYDEEFIAYYSTDGKLLNAHRLPRPDPGMVYSADCSSYDPVHHEIFIGAYTVDQEGRIKQKESKSVAVLDTNGTFRRFDFESDSLLTSYGISGSLTSALFAHRDSSIVWTHSFARAIHVRRADSEVESQFELTGRWFRKDRSAWKGSIDLNSKKSLRAITEFFSPLIYGLDFQNGIILLSGTKVNARDRSRSIMQFYGEKDGKLIAEYDVTSINRAAYRRYFWSGVRQEMLSYSQDDQHLYLDFYSIR